jgi:hypothetical protein
MWGRFKGNHRVDVKTVKHDCKPKGKKTKIGGKIMLIYIVEDPCQFCNGTWGKHSGRKDVCPMCEKKYMREENDKHKER